MPNNITKLQVFSDAVEVVGHFSNMPRRPFLTNRSTRIPIGIGVRTSRFVQKRVPRIDVRDESNTVIGPVQVDACGETPRPIPFVKRMVSSRGLLLIAVVVLGAWLMLRGVDAIGGGAVLRDRYGFASATILVPLHAIVAVSPFPGELVAFGNSILFGFWLGTVCNWTGWMMAAVIQYGLARRMAQDFDFDAATLRRTRWLRTIPVHHPMFLIVG